MSHGGISMPGAQSAGSNAISPYKPKRQSGTTVKKSQQYLGDDDLNDRVAFDRSIKANALQN